MGAAKLFQICINTFNDQHLLMDRSLRIYQRNFLKKEIFVKMENENLEI